MRSRFALTCALLPSLLSGAAYHQDFAPKARSIKAKEPAPRFNATTTAGEKFSNVSIKGKVVLLEFWTTCAPSAPPKRPSLTKSITNLPARISSCSLSTSANPKKP